MVMNRSNEQNVMAHPLNENETNKAPYLHRGRQTLLCLR